MLEPLAFTLPPPPDALDAELLTYSSFDESYVTFISAVTSALSAPAAYTVTVTVSPAFTD